MSTIEGSTKGEFSYPMGLCFSEKFKCLFVCDYSNNKLKTISTTGNQEEKRREEEKREEERRQERKSKREENKRKEKKMMLSLCFKKQEKC